MSAWQAGHNSPSAVGSHSGHSAGTSGSLRPSRPGPPAAAERESAYPEFLKPHWEVRPRDGGPVVHRGSIVELVAWLGSRPSDELAGLAVIDRRDNWRSERVAQWARTWRARVERVTEREGGAAWMLPGFDPDAWRPSFPKGWRPCEVCGHGVKAPLRTCAICEAERAGRPVLSPELIASSLRLGEVWAPVIPECPPAAPTRKLPNAERAARRGSERATAGAR